MKSRINPQFRRLFQKLLPDVREQARKSYRLFRDDPYHPSLHFKRIQANEPYYSVRVNLGYRALGVWSGDVIVWFWIGSHADYDKLISQF